MEVVLFIGVNHFKILVSESKIWLFENAYFTQVLKLLILMECLFLHIF